MIEIGTRLLPKKTTTNVKKQHSKLSLFIFALILRSRRLEHYFCSCELNESLPYEEAIAELDECLKYRRLFTVQPCYEQINIGLSEERGRIIKEIEPVSWIIFYTLLGISCFILILCCFAKPQLRSRRSSFRRRYSL